MIIVGVGLLLLSLSSTGCVAANPNKGRVVGGTAVGTKIGVSENPVSGLYEFGGQRVQTSFVVVPGYLTNGVYVTPDVVTSYEVQGRNGVFGNAGGTFTFAVGSNACQTLLGGAHHPINQTLVISTNVGSVVPK